MLLSNYVICILILIAIEGSIRKWYKKNGNNYEKDKTAHTSFSITRGCVLILSLYLTIMTLFVGIKLDKDVPEQGTSIYIYPDNDEKYNYFSSDFIDNYVGDLSEITEETYFDKVNISVQKKNISLGLYLKNVLCAPFGVNYNDFYKIESEYIANTGLITLTEVAEVSGNVISFSEIKIRMNSTSGVINNGDFVQATIVYDKGSVEEGVIEKYVLIGGEYYE